MTLRALALLLVLLVDGALAARAVGAPARGRRVLVLAAPVHAREPNARWDHPLASLTSDDVARGAWAIDRQGALAPGQVEVIRPLLAEGARRHAEVGELRMRVRALRGQWLGDQGALAVALKDAWPAAVHR